MKKKKPLYKRMWKITRRILFFPYYLTRYVVRDILIPKIYLSHCVKKLNTDNKEIFIMNSIPFNETLYQRAQHQAVQLSKKYFILYLDNRQIFYKRINDNLYLINSNINIKGSNIYYLIRIDLPIFNVKQLQKMAKKYKVIIEYLDEINSKIICNEELVKDSFKILNNLDKIKPFLVLTTAKNLEKEIKEKFPNQKVILNQNGVCVEDFQYDKNSRNIPNDLKNILEQNKPIVGYYGVIAPWLDYKLLNKAMKERKNYNFVLIGPNYGKINEADINLIKSNTNCYLLGKKEYKELLNYSQWFNCAIIPFELGNLAKSTSPLKLFEYMATKKPVVCTKDLLECYGYEGVLIAGNSEDFINKLDIAVAMEKNEEIRNKLLSQAIDNSWEKRSEDIINEININKRKIK